MTSIRCVITSPHVAPRAVDVDDTYEGFREALGFGPLDTMGGILMRVAGIVCVAYHDDDGRLKELTPSVVLRGQPFLVGPVLLAKWDGRDGETTMTEAEAEAIISLGRATGIGTWVVTDDEVFSALLGEDEEGGQ